MQYYLYNIKASYLVVLSSLISVHYKIEENIILKEYFIQMSVWNIYFQPELTSSIKSPKDIPKVVDAEWSGSDRPILATVDGCIHMLDLSLKRSTCPIEERDLSGMYTYLLVHMHNS